MNLNETLFFIAFNAFVLLLLFFDLKIIGKKNHIIKMKEALI